MSSPTAGERRVVSVELSERSYPIIVGSGLLAEFAMLLDGVATTRRTFVISDNQVDALYAGAAAEQLRAAGYVVGTASVPAGEASKSLRWASHLWDEMVRIKSDRKTVVVAIGGGVVGDLAGFVAATYARGVPFVQVPTTLLAMVDASVGGKVAVDHPQGKNLIGAFHQPKLVVCDLATLRTLRIEEYRSGLAEVVKYGVIMDAPFFELLEKSVDSIVARDDATLADIVGHCCELKARVVKADEFETLGRREILNYGHTFAHALETAGGYTAMRHGEAVAIGMTLAAELSVRGNRIDRVVERRQTALLTKLGLPTRVPRELLAHDLVSLMRGDKKSAGGNLRLVLPTALGAVETVPWDDTVAVRRTIDDLAT